ncbi:hypothetical protein B6U74_05240 [Candidatus Bathyarchaeota archaeon ex4484_205]|nr:MAG: hypothetical protein B6U74_05240 [Candidatus Bathyarchaeota archaeon ex4484_205]RLA96713.1 MAG: hypothetical protein DRG69_00015 [Deltaproteobacteria bacterium]RLF70308.1 MAG: hypothetical protein DRN40_04875 [Thermoplasmata archaeon]
MDEKNLKEALSHTFKELEFHNISISIYRCDFQKLRVAHDSVHEFRYLAANIVKSEEQCYTRSAFLLYHWEASDRAHLSFLNALMGHYNAAYTLLRNTLELIIKGAFWECLAHKKYRKTAEIVEKESGKKIENYKITLTSVLDKAISENPSIEDELENCSVSILDAISPFFEGNEETIPNKKKIIPNVKVMVKQLAFWGIFDPIQEVTDPVEYIYGLYSELSDDVHVTLDRTDIGRRLLSGKELFETEVIVEELNKYCENLHKVMDIGIVAELNIFEDYITQDDKTRVWLKERLADITMLGLNYSSTKIMEVLR